MTKDNINNGTKPVESSTEATVHNDSKGQIPASVGLAQTQQLSKRSNANGWQLSYVTEDKSK